MKNITITSPMTGLPVEAYKEGLDLAFVNPITGQLVTMQYDAQKHIYELPVQLTAYEPLMTVESAADYLGVSRQRVCRLIKDGKIASVRHGLTQRPIEKSVKAYAESERKAGRPWPSKEG